MEKRYGASPVDAKKYDTNMLRESFLIEGLFTPDNLKMVYSHIDRVIVVGAKPVHKELDLTGSSELAADYFLQRRELGIINIGGDGYVIVDGTKYDMAHLDGIYIGMGNKEICFGSADSSNSAKFYMNSAPAHMAHPTVKIDISKAKKVPAGDAKDCNKRVINQFIHPDVLKTCQLTMGLTVLEEGSVWNTMPCHTHDRRMEVYFYFDINPDACVFHLCGEPQETRHIVVKNEQAVISPSWSIHSGVGTSNYAFIWGMAGENQTFIDMDMIKTEELK